MWKKDDVVGLRYLEAAKSIVGHRGEVQQTTPSASSDIGSRLLTYGQRIVTSGIQSSSPQNGLVDKSHESRVLQICFIKVAKRVVKRPAALELLRPCKGVTFAVCSSSIGLFVDFQENLEMRVIPRVRLEVVVFVEPVPFPLLVRCHTEHSLLSLALVLKSLQKSSQEKMVHVIDNGPDLRHLWLGVVLEDTTDQTAIPLTRLHAEAGAVDTDNAAAGVDEALECLELGRIEKLARAL